MAVTVPGAEYMLANPVSTRPVLPSWCCCHTIVGTVNSAISGRHYHLYVRGHGSFIQRQDLALRSAASVETNPYSIAIVAEDKGPHFAPWSGSDVPPYTPQQVASLKLIISWICHRFGIPKTAARTVVPRRPHGVAWHRLGIDGDFPKCGPTGDASPAASKHHYRRQAVSRQRPHPPDRRRHRAEGLGAQTPGGLVRYGNPSRPGSRGAQGAQVSARRYRCRGLETRDPRRRQPGSPGGIASAVGEPQRRQSRRPPRSRHRTSPCLNGTEAGGKDEG